MRQIAARSALSWPQTALRLLAGSALAESVPALNRFWSQGLPKIRSRLRRLSGLFHQYDHVRCAQFGMWQGARRAHPPKWGCNRRATQPQAKFGATRQGGSSFSARLRCSLLTDPLRDMRVVRASSGRKIPCRERDRIYEIDHLGYGVPPSGGRPHAMTPTLKRVNVQNRGPPTG